jgi:general secretion pathway protein D
MKNALGKSLLAAAVVAGLAGVANAQRGGRGGGNNATAAGVPVQASADTRTNTVVVSASEQNMTQIENVIRELDQNPTKNNEVFIYPIRNGTALNIEAVANLLFNGTGGNNRGLTTSNGLTQNRIGSGGGIGGNRGGGGGLGGGLGGGGFGGGGFGGGGIGGGGRIGGGGIGGTATFGGVGTSAQAAAAGLQGQVVVVADPNTNTLIVTTHPDNWTVVKRILDQLDRAVPQVLIKVLIAEVTHTNSSDLGVEFSALNLRFNDSGTLSGGAQGGTNFNIPVTGTNATGAIVQITEANFNAVIRALATNGKLDVLSRPYILASDNQLATITVGQTVPFVSSSNTTAQGNTINTVQYQDVGILLDVIPHINPDGMVILDVAPEISALTTSSVQVSEQVSSPIFTKRSAQTRVAVENGQTVVIGGLMQDQKNSTISKVPLLGDIPGLGLLFQRRIEDRSKTELLIFLTPHVAMRPDQLEAMGQDEVDHTKLVTDAVAPGMFQDQMEGMKTGAAAPTTQATSAEIEALRQQYQEQERQRAAEENNRAGRGGRGGSNADPNSVGGFGPGGGQGDGGAAAPDAPPPPAAPAPGGGE